MLRILIIDDDEDYLIMMGQWLKKEGYETLLLNKGNEAIPQIRKFQPDLVISDIIMPGISGSCILDTIRKKIGDDLPVIISSGTSMKIKGKKDMFLDYCPKPIDFKKLSQTIQRLVSLGKDNKKDATKE